MKIMIMAQHFWPEEVSGAVLGTELATDLVDRGHEVTYLTCAPNYPLGKVYQGYKNKLYSEEKLHGIRIIRIWSFISHKTFWRRILNYGTFSISSLLGGIIAGKPDIILSYSPPLPLGVSAWLLSRIWRVPWILNVMDIFPEIAIVTGVLKNQFVITFFEKVERFLYRKAKHIQVLSEGFYKNLTKKGVEGGKISIIPVWADPQQIIPREKDNAFRQEFGLEEKFVILYSGNLGMNTSLEDVILAAELMRDDQSVSFLLVGEGVRKNELQALAKENELENVQFLPFQPRERYNELLAAADVGLVTLSADAHHTSMPSKTYNIMASARPIIALAPQNSDLANLVMENDCGVIVPPHHPQELCEAIQILQKDNQRLNEMGSNGRDSLIEKYSRQNSVDLYIIDFQRFEIS